MACRHTRTHTHTQMHAHSDTGAGPQRQTLTTQTRSLSLQGPSRPADCFLVVRSLHSRKSPRWAPGRSTSWGPASPVGPPPLSGSLPSLVFTLGNTIDQAA